MSVTKDGNTGRWMSQIRVTDWTGKVIQKRKEASLTFILCYSAVRFVLKTYSQINPHKPQILLSTLYNYQQTILMLLIVPLYLHFPNSGHIPYALP